MINALSYFCFCIIASAFSLNFLFSAFSTSLANFCWIVSEWYWLLYTPLMTADKNIEKVILTHYSLVFLFYTPWKQQKTSRFSDVFRGYRKATLGCNRSMLLFCWIRDLMEWEFRDRLHILLLILSEFKRIIYLLFPLKSSVNKRFSDDFRVDRISLVRLNLRNFETVPYHSSSAQLTSGYNLNSTKIKCLYGVCRRTLQNFD